MICSFIVDDGIRGYCQLVGTGDGRHVDRGNLKLSGHLCDTCEKCCDELSTGVFVLWGETVTEP